MAPILSLIHASRSPYLPASSRSILTALLPRARNVSSLSIHCGPSSLSQSLHVALIDPTCFLGLLRDVAGTFSILFDLATIWTILLRALHLFDPIDASHRQFQDFLADQVDTTRNLSRFTFAQLFKKSARAGSALPSDDTVLLTNTACVGCKKCPVHCLKDGRWRPKPGSKFDNVKSPPPLLVTTPLAAPKLFSLSFISNSAPHVKHVKTHVIRVFGPADV